MKLQDANLQVYEKNSFANPPLCILHYFFQRGLQAGKFFFRKYRPKVVLLVIYLLNYDSFKSTSFMLNVALGFVISTVFVK